MIVPTNKHNTSLICSYYTFHCKVVINPHSYLPCPCDNKVIHVLAVGNGTLYNVWIVLPGVLHRIYSFARASSFPTDPFKNYSTFLFLNPCIWIYSEYLIGSELYEEVAVV